MQMRDYATIIFYFRNIIANCFRSIIVALVPLTNVIIFEQSCFKLAALVICINQRDGKQPLN